MAIRVIEFDTVSELMQYNKERYEQMQEIVKEDEKEFAGEQKPTEKKVVVVQPKQDPEGKKQKKRLKVSVWRKDFEQNYEKLVAAIRKHHGKPTGLLRFMQQVSGENPNSELIYKYRKAILERKPALVKVHETPQKASFAGVRTVPESHRVYLKKVAKKAKQISTETGQQYTKCFAQAHSVVAGGQENKTDTMIRRRPVVPTDARQVALNQATIKSAKFPFFKSVKTQDVKKLIQSVIYNNVGLDYSVANGSIGIDNQEQWQDFLEEFLEKSTRIADYFGEPDRFRLVGSTKGTVLVYGGTNAGA